MKTFIWKLIFEINFKVKCIDNSAYIINNILKKKKKSGMKITTRLKECSGIKWCPQRKKQKDAWSKMLIVIQKWQTFVGRGGWGGRGENILSVVKISHFFP